ncbi:MAG: transglycosylase SLT domain-containing protein [Roseovarius sp.]
MVTRILRSWINNPAVSKIYELAELKFFVFCFFANIFSAPLHANTSALCDRAAKFASNKTGVPLEVLLAITRIETGRGNGGALSPWPWTVNMEGAGKWFSSQDEAIGYISRHYGNGARSFDVGCFQINFRWHGENFSSINQMFEPTANALYAAEFLKDLRRDTGDWSGAAGAYHSKTPMLSARYRSRFDKIMAGLPEAAAKSVSFSSHKGPVHQARKASGSDSLRSNSYPFLRTAVVETRFGSLVPLGTSGGKPGHFFFGMENSQ